MGIYLNPVFDHISTSTADTGTFSFLGPGTTSRMFYGLDIGGYYDFFHAPKFNAGIDVRDVITHGNNAELKSFLVGARVSTKFREKIKPYVQVSDRRRQLPRPRQLPRRQQSPIRRLRRRRLRPQPTRRLAGRRGRLRLRHHRQQRDRRRNHRHPRDSVLSFSTGFVFRFR